MTGRLIVVSNRIPTDEVPSGGLVVALHEALADRGGLWLGAHPDISEEPDDTLVALEGTGYDKLAFRLTAEERDTYYLGYANSVLWPLCHRRGDLIRLDREFASGYLAVNRRIARHLAEIAGPDDRIWVQDYHFLPLAAELRKLGVTARIGLFLHIPFPGPADLEALPEHDDFLCWMASFDLVGLQTRADVARCLEVYRDREDSELVSDGRVRHCGRTFSVAPFPIGIDVEGFARESRCGSGAALLGLKEDERLVIGVDRLDYSKGLPNRLRAFGRFLSNRLADPARQRPRATLLQIAPPSREEVEAYRQLREEIEELAGHINGEHAELDWTPIRYIHRALPRKTLATLYRSADVGLVTPLADGMNLVAKEYVAAQNPGDPGVLILSRSAGAAEELEDALIVNPYDIDEIAEALEQAIAMPRSERLRRYEGLISAVRGSDIAIWTERFLTALGADGGRTSAQGGGLAAGDGLRVVKFNRPAAAPTL